MARLVCQKMENIGFERERERDITATTEGEIFTIVRRMTYVASNTSSLNHTHTHDRVCMHDDAHMYVHADEKSKSTVYARASMILRQGEKKTRSSYTLCC